MNNRSIIFGFLALFSLSANAMDPAKLEQINKIKKMASLQVFSPDQKGVKVFHNGKHFFVKEKHMPIKQIHNYDVDPLLQKMNHDQLDTFQKTAGLLVAKRLSNGEYKLNAHVKGLGGGYWGAAAGFWTGWTVTNVVFQGGVVIACRAIDIVAPGVGATIQPGLQLAIIPVQTWTAKVVGLAGGIAGGAATGPM